MQIPLVNRFFGPKPGRLARRTKSYSPLQVPAVRRLRFEELESREVPASMVWTNAMQDGLFSTAGNWFNLDTGMVAITNPLAGDDVLFDGNVSSANCNEFLEAGQPGPVPLGQMPPPAGIYHSVQLIHGYSGVVTAPGGFETQILTLQSGAICQPNGNDSDVFVLASFTWTGGTLGGSLVDTSNPHFIASNSALHLLSGSISSIDPGDGHTVATGDTLSFENNSGVGSTATFASGIVNFVGGLGVSIDSLCAVNAQAKPAQVRFQDSPAAGSAAKMIKVKAGGQMYVRSAVEADGGTYESALPVWNLGLFQVEKNATASIKGAIPLGNPQTDPSFYQCSAGAATKIENGSRLVTEKGFSFCGGKLATLAKANPPQNFAQSATIGGKVSLNSGDIFICDGAGPHVFGNLVFEDDVWLGAVTLHIVLDGRAPGTGDAGKSDLFDFRSNLLDGLYAPILKITTINIPQGGLNQGQIWQFVNCANAILAEKPTVVSETPGVNYQVLDVNQNHQWRLKPTA